MNSVVKLPAVLFCAVLGLTSTLAQTPLVNHGDSWRYRKGTSAPQSDWKTASDSGLDASWLTGNGGLGYADNATETMLCQTILSDMRNAYTTVCLRRSFTVAAAVDPNLHFQLRMDWDDGFIAWLDGSYLTSVNSPLPPAQPAFNAMATALHESSNGDPASRQPAMTFDLGAVGTRLPVGTHVLAILGLNQATNSSDFIQIADFSLATNNPNCVSGAISVNTTWHATNSPIPVCGNLTINSGVTLTIEPGTTVQLNAAVNLTVASGGRLLAEGTSNAPIHFTHSAPGENWGHITINGAVGSPETRIGYADFQFNADSTGTPCIEVMAGTAYLDHLTFGNTGAPYIHVDEASFVISHCYFPTATDTFELCHGTGGVKPGGHGLFLRNFFGKATGYNDVVDFTGGNRPGLPIVHFIENVVTGGDDDGFDLDGTDAWVEGNIFLHLHKNRGTPDSSSAVSGGNYDFGASGPGGVGVETSEITVIGNIIYDCDEATDAKQGNFYTFFNNTIVHQTHQGGVDTDGAIVILADTGTTEGAGVYLEGNIIYDAEKLTRNVTSAIVTFTNNLMPFPWSGPGGNNSTNDPMLKHIPQLSETVFTNWEQAQIMRDWFSLLPGSPGIGTGPNGRDKGAVIPMGASISGEPAGTTSANNATLIVGSNRTGSGIPVAGFPNGSGYTAYRWRLDTNAWSAETSIHTPIHLANLANGPHYVEVTGKRDSSLYQNDPLFEEDALLTRSGSWTVQALRIDSISLVGNVATLIFTAQAGKTYTVLCRDALDAAVPWIKLRDIPAQSSTGPITVMDSNAGASATRFYALVTPAQP